MLRQIALWLLGIIETSLDPDLQARLDAYKLKVEAAEVEETRLLNEIEASRVKLTGLAQELTDNNRKKVELESSIAHAKEQAAIKKAELDALSGPDRVRVDL